MLGLSVFQWFATKIWWQTTESLKVRAFHAEKSYSENPYCKEEPTLFMNSALPSIKWRELLKLGVRHSVSSILESHTA